MALPTARTAPTTSAMPTDRMRVLRDVLVCSLIMLATLLSLWCTSDSLRSRLWRRQRRRNRRLLQHVLELRIHRLGATVDPDERNLMTARVLLFEGMLVRQVRRDFTFGTIGDLEHRVAHPQPRARRQLARAANEVLALYQRFGEIHG